MLRDFSCYRHVTMKQQNLTLVGGDNDDIAVKSSNIRITPDELGSAITGITFEENELLEWKAAAQNEMGVPMMTYLIYLKNVGTAALTLKHNNVNSTAGNRIFCKGAADLILLEGEGCILQLDKTSLGEGWYVN